MYELVFGESYLKKEKKFFHKHPDLLERYGKILHILASDPQHPSLRLHRLQGRQREYHSISITMQYRAVIYLEIKGKQITFVDIGGHEVYR